MARPRKYKIELTDDELKSLKSTIHKSKTSKTIRSRCQIIIDLDEAHGKVLTHEQSAKSNGVCLATITNTVTMQDVSLMDVQKHILLNLPVARFLKDILDGLCFCWKKNPKRVCESFSVNTDIRGLL